MARKRKLIVSILRPRLLLKDKALQVGCRLGSLGDIEQLAGVNIQSEEERRKLWWQFHHLFNGPSQELFDAVMDHCAEIALRRIKAGELCLVETRYC
ncbi:MAG: hypothetical protein BGO63_03690 [Candidatus Accumulibacter sp. 66-26]|nr:MAG: hypothetical protein BGO63_03690 [Candidatus Accumulibacter sp. 66-26]